MLSEFIVVSFASFIGWTLFKSFAWFEVSARLTTLIVFLISFLMTFADKPSILIAFAATGGCALLFSFISPDSIEPIDLTALRLPKRREHSRQLPDKTIIQKRIPPL